MGVEAAHVPPFADSAPLVLLPAALAPLEPPDGDSAARVLLGADSAALGVPLPSGAESALGFAAELLRGGAGWMGAVWGVISRRWWLSACMHSIRQAHTRPLVLASDWNWDADDQDSLAQAPARYSRPKSQCKL